jgi:hypothetical protein
VSSVIGSYGEEMVTFSLTILDLNRMFSTGVMFLTSQESHAKLWYLMDLAILLVICATFDVIDMV